MNTVAWELSVLSRAIKFPNLSAASPHVGLSQPQLSRIVAKLESSLKMQLLDRSARRRSIWLPDAYKICESFARFERQFESEIDVLRGTKRVERVRVGFLEGLSITAVNLAIALSKAERPRYLELSVFDLSDLESRFLNGELDLVLTAREPGSKKRRFIERLGWQVLEHRNFHNDQSILSPYEHSKLSRKAQEREQIVVSNSLLVRQLWIESTGASGFVPSDVLTSKPRSGQAVEVLMIAQESWPLVRWSALVTIVRRALKL
jgi:DNA-binding transcriptional LysR family regulator